MVGLMEFSRAMLAASASVLGILLYIVAALLIVLALTMLARAEPNGPSAGAAAFVGLCFSVAGLGLRFLARRLV